MPSEETRSLIEIGSKKRSAAITLPKGWIKFWKLRVKEKVPLIYDGVLVVIPPSHPDKKDIEGKIRSFLLKNE